MVSPVAGLAASRGGRAGTALARGPHVLPAGRALIAHVVAPPQDGADVLPWDSGLEGVASLLLATPTASLRGLLQDHGATPRIVPREVVVKELLERAWEARPVVVKHEAAAQNEKDYSRNFC